jgi:hypothetical protein
MMENAVEHGGDRSHIARQFALVFNWPVGSEQRAGALVAPHDDLQQILSRSQRQFAHTEIVDNEQRRGGHHSMNCLRLPSATASARSSSSTCVSLYITQ